MYKKAGAGVTGQISTKINVLSNLKLLDFSKRIKILTRCLPPPLAGYFCFGIKCICCIYKLCH